jgi:hypothetical protein
LSQKYDINLKEGVNSNRKNAILPMIQSRMQNVEGSRANEQRQITLKLALDIGECV